MAFSVCEACVNDGVWGSMHDARARARLRLPRCLRLLVHQVYGFGRLALDGLDLRFDRRRHALGLLGHLLVLPDELLEELKMALVVRGIARRLLWNTGLARLGCRLRALARRPRWLRRLLRGWFEGRASLLAVAVGKPEIVNCAGGARPSEWASKRNRAEGKKCGGRSPSACCLFRLDFSAGMVVCGNARSRCQYDGGAPSSKWAAGRAPQKGWR